MIAGSCVIIQNDDGDRVSFDVTQGVVTIDIDRPHSEDAVISVSLSDFVTASLAIRALDRP